MARMYIPTILLYGSDSLLDLHKEHLPFKKALVVTTNGTSFIKYGYLDKVINELKLANIEVIVFSKILQNPIKEHVMEGAAIAKLNGCDVIVGLGGGSPIDSSKSIAVMATNPGDYWDYISGGSGLGKPLVNKPLPVIAITTTAGTGTEADPFTVITSGTEKIGFGDDTTYPYISVCDPKLMLTVPKDLTLFQAFDALFHSLEGFINISHNDLNDAFSRQAISLIYKNLPLVMKDLNNLKAREGVALANTLSGMNESTSGCTGEHSIEHALSGISPNLVHGKGLIIISLAYYELIIKKGIAHDRFIELAALMGFEKPTKPEDFLTALKEFEESLDVTKYNLETEGFKKEQFEEIALHALKTMPGCFAADPHDWTVEDIVEVLEKSF